MRDSLLTKPIHRARHPSTITGSSVDTISTAITTATSVMTKNTRNTRSRGRTGADGAEIGDTNSHHSQSSADDESSLVSVKSGLSRCCKQGSLALRRWQLFQLLFLPFIPITALIIQNSTLLSTVVANLQEASEMQQQINTIVQIGKILTELQQERAEFGFCLFTKAPEYLNLSSYHQRVGSGRRASRNIKTSYFRKSVNTIIGNVPPLPSSSGSMKTFSSTISTTITVPSHLNSFPSVGSSSSSVTSFSSLSTPPLPRTSVVPFISKHEKGMPDKMQNSLCRSSLFKRFNRTDTVINNLSTYVSSYVPTVASLSGNNGSVDDTSLGELLWYNVANDVILDLLSDQIRKTTTSEVWKALIAYKNMIRCIENYSITTIYGLYYFGKGKLTQESYNKFIQFDSLATDYLNASKSFSPEVSILWERFIGQNWKLGYAQITKRRAVIYKNDRGENGASNYDAKTYYANMTTYIDELRKFQTHLKAVIDTQVMDEMVSARVKKIVAASLLALVLFISPVIIILVKNVTTTIQSYSMILSSKTAELKREKRKSDRLLQQMLPAEVIRQLRAKKQVPAESFESVTIYFSDIVSFTSISASSSPMEIVIMLNSLYKMFDSRIENYDVYKVETIGDAYMVVSGLPLRNGILHAGEICTMALDLIAGIKNFEIPHQPGVGLQIRIGVNTGCCVAGVVGTKMPRYCLFGDAINVASRMESHGEPMKIHITESTKAFLDEIGGFTVEERGPMEVKGKGAMNTFWLVDKIGGIPRSLEMTTPGFFKTESSSAAHTPEFLREIFGNSDSDEEIGGTMDAVQLNVTKLEVAFEPHASSNYELSGGSGGGRMLNVPQNSNSFFPSRFQGCNPS